MDLLHGNTTRRLNTSLVRFRLLQILCFVIFFGLTSTPVWSCQGEDREKTMQLLHDALVIGYLMGFTGDIQKYWPALVDVGNRVSDLPPSCQDLLQRISNQFGGVHNPNTTRCIGGVCCDSSGCY